MKRRANKPAPQKGQRIHYDPHPSGYTLFRHQIFDELARQVMLEMHERLKDRLWLRDRAIVQRIAAADSLEQLLDLAPLAVGMGQDAWEARLQEFKPELVRLAIVERLNAAQLTKKVQEERSKAFEHYFRVLRWQGKVGAQVLAECFERLDAYNQGLACVVFGLVKEATAADRIWEFYQQDLAKSAGKHALGAMWGLVDLGDRRAVPALVDWLKSGKWNYELFGWLSMRGDLSTAGPLMQAIVLSPEKVRVQPLMALISVAHRVGEADFTAEMQRTFQDEAPGEELRSMTRNLFSQPASLAEEHFETFYKGLTLDSVRNVLNRL